MNFVFAALAAASLAATGDIARVDSTVISRSEFVERAGALRARGNKATAEDVLGSLIDETVLAGEASRLGLGNDPAVSERLAGERRRVVVKALVQSLAASAKPSDDELRAAYHATSDFVRAQTLFYATEEEARGGATRLRNGTALLDESKRATYAQVSARDSDVPYTMRAQMDPALAAALLGARPGAVVGPTNTGHGWAVAKVLEIVIGDDAGFSTSRAALYARAQAGAGELARKHLASQLLARTPSSIDDEFLLGAKVLDAGPADLQHVVATVGNERIKYSEVLLAIRGLAPSGGAHTAGPATRRQVVRSLVEERVLYAAAAERGIASQRDVQAQLGLAQRNVLASAALERIWGSTGPAKDERLHADAVRSRVDALRAKASISVDRAVLAQAASSLK